MISKLFKRSLGQDAVDRWNHTWSFLLLLILFLIVFLLPLSPRFAPPESATKTNSCQPKTSTSRPSVFRIVNDDVECDISGSRYFPTYEAKCWTPDQFTSAYVSYANTYCANSFNDQIRGGNLSNAVYSTSQGTRIPVGDDKVSETIQKMVAQREKMDSDNAARQQDIDSKYVDWFAYRTPFMLAVFAFVIKLPHIIWILLSGCVGLNVDQLLESVERSRTSEPGRRKEVANDVARSVLDNTQKSRCITMDIYIIFKFLMVIAAVASLLFTAFHVFPFIDDLEADIKNLDHGNSEVDSEKLMGEFPFGIYLCDFEVSAGATAHSYTVQCLISPLQSSLSSPLPTASNERILANVYMYKALFTTLVTGLAVLSFINVSSFLTWNAKNYIKPCRSKILPGKSYPEDVFFLLYMARENLGQVAVADLIKGFEAQDGEGNNGESKDGVMPLTEH